MTWLLEEPIYILILGVLMLAFLGFALMQTGYRKIFHAMLAVVALTAGLLLLESLVLTEREQLEADLETIARDVESNDLETILSHVYSGAPKTRADAQREFPNYSFDRVDIKNNVEIAFEMDHQPPKALVTFNVVVEVRRDSIDFGSIPRFVKVTLMFENGHWRVAEYSHHDLRGTFQLPDGN